MLKIAENNSTKIGIYDNKNPKSNTFSLGGRAKVYRAEKCAQLKTQWLLKMSTQIWSGFKVYQKLNSLKKVFKKITNREITSLRFYNHQMLP